MIDYFTDTDGVNLTAHTAPSGHTWSKDALSGAGSLLVGTNRIYSSGVNPLYVSSWTPPSADYDIAFTMVKRTTLAQRAGVMGRFVTGSSNWLFAEFRNETSQALWSLSEVKAGSVTQTATSPTGTIANDAVLNCRLRVLGTAVTFLVNGNPVAALTTTLSAAGKVAVFHTDATSSSSTGMHVDDFSTDRIALPVADVAAGSWTTDTGAVTGLSAAVDDGVTAVDTDYIKSSTSPAVDRVKLTLGTAAALDRTKTWTLVVRHKKTT